MKNTIKIIDLKSVRERKALGALFKPRQLEIIDKILRMEKLSKIENEVYSRKIKKKLNAIIDVYNIAIVTRSKQ